MGLLDLIQTAKASDGANYMKKGRHVIRVTRVQFRDGDENPELGDGFNFDGKILATNNPEKHSKGDVVRGNHIFSNPKMRSENVARMRATLTAMLSSKESRLAKESEITKEKVKELTNASQPLVDAVVTVIATEGVGKDSGKPYTVYKVQLPDADDLDAAGIGGGASVT